MSSTLKDTDIKKAASSLIVPSHNFSTYTPVHTDTLDKLNMFQIITLITNRPRYMYSYNTLTHHIYSNAPSSADVRIHKHSFKQKIFS